MSEKIEEIMNVLKAGRITYTFESNESKVMVGDVVNSLESTIEDNNINVSIQSNLPAITCDKERLKVVFLNLIGNAVKFMGDDVPHNSPLEKMGEGGLRQINIGCDRNGKDHKFFVEDTGIGIRKEHQKHIFKIFRRLNDIKVEGTGVGLTIVRKIVKMHKGKIWIESPVKDGRGSRFCFTIPIEMKI
jgi:signal transduction histidine kinase